MRILQEDIVDRLYYSARHWIFGPPIVKVTGCSRTFGKIEFVFPNKIVSYNIWISKQEDISHYLNVAQRAIRNFSSIYFELDKSKLYGRIKKGK